jgi:hypothetical protein
MVILSEFSSKNSFLTVLPSGQLNQTEAYSALIIVFVSDSLGAQSNATQSVVVYPYKFFTPSNLFDF